MTSTMYDEPVWADDLPAEPIKFYVIVRADLKPGYQAVQAMHAAINLCMTYPRPLEDWWTNSNTLILLSVPNVYQLYLHHETARYMGLMSALFYEPDIGEDTALALFPSDAAAELTRDLPLALPNKKWWRFWE